MAGLGIRHIQIPVTEDEYEQIDALRDKNQSWREYALPRLVEKKEDT